MEKLDRFVGKAQALLLAAYMFALGLGKMFAEKQLGQTLNEYLVAVLFFVGILLGILVSRWLVERYLITSRWVRRRVLKGDFIEGRWKDVVFRPNSDKPSTGGVLTISYADGTWQLHGESYNADGRRIGSFKSLFSDYRDGELRFCFSKGDKTRNRDDVPGFSTYKFNPSLLTSRTGPGRFDGHFFKAGDPTMYQVYGEPLTAEDERRLAGEHGAAGVVQTFIARYEGVRAR